MGLFQDRTKQANGKTGVPVWFMRQAGRYHQHYQDIKKDSDFMTMCKDPQLACDVTMGPVESFNFDAAILFSDLLFPLEQMGLGLTYAPGPKLKTHLTSLEIVKSLKVSAPAEKYYDFQKEACSLIRKALPKERTLLGFVGGPWTLYTYAVDGGHSGSLIEPKKGLYDGRWQAFCDFLFDNLLMEMDLQAQGGAEGMCIFDTAAGECAFEEYRDYIVPQIKRINAEFKRRHPNVKIIYYSKLTQTRYLDALEDDNIDVLGVDWRMDLPETIKRFGKDYMIEGNLDPALLHLPWNQLEKRLISWWQMMQDSGAPLDRWICGLGHGVLQKTPEENVYQMVEFIHKNMHY